MGEGGLEYAICDTCAPVCMPCTHVGHTHTHIGAHVETQYYTYLFAIGEVVLGAACGLAVQAVDGVKAVVQPK